MYIALAVIAAIAVYVVFIYNGLVTARQMKEEAWSGIDVQLKRRADLIPNLIETVKGYAAHEKSTFEEVVAMRNRAQAVPAGDVEGRAQAEGLLSQALGKLFALAEAYPDLKANQGFLELQKSLDKLLQIASRLPLHASGDFLGAEFKQKIGHIYFPVSWIFGWPLLAKFAVDAQWYYRAGGVLLAGW